MGESRGFSASDPGRCGWPIKEPRRPAAEPPALRAEFFRFLDAKGAVMPAPETAGGSLPAGEAQLTMPALSSRQEVGYVVWESRDRRATLHEVIATPIITTDT